MPRFQVVKQGTTGYNFKQTRQRPCMFKCFLAPRTAPENNVLSIMMLIAVRTRAAFICISVSTTTTYMLQHSGAGPLPLAQPVTRHSPCCCDERRAIAGAAGSGSAHAPSYDIFFIFQWQSMHAAALPSQSRTCQSYQGGKETKSSLCHGCSASSVVPHELWHGMAWHGPRGPSTFSGGPPSAK